MNLRATRAEEPELNITSLIDVVLLLLIFFMVSTSFVNESDLQIQLPESDAVAVSNPDAPIIIGITAAGTFYVNQKELVNRRPATLRNALIKEAGDERGQPITIRADGDAKHQDVVTVMDVAGRLGFTQINLATERSDR